MTDDPARPMVAADSNREMQAAQQRISDRTARMAALDGQATANGDSTGQLEAQYNDLGEQNKLDQWRMNNGYLNSNGIVQLPEPTDYLDELRGQPPGSAAAENMTPAQMNGALSPFEAESRQLSSHKMLDARVAAGQMSPNEAEAEKALIDGGMGVGAATALGATRRARRANPNGPPSATQECPPASPPKPITVGRWTAKDVKGRRVYQRNDLIDPTKTDDKGRTNLQRMQAGLAPLGPDGKPVNLHHLTQIEPGPMAEVEQTFHQQNTKTLHMPGQYSFRNDEELDRSFEIYKRQYWRERAQDFLPPSTNSSPNIP